MLRMHGFLRPLNHAVCFGSQMLQNQPDLISLESVHGRKATQILSIVQISRCGLALNPGALQRLLGFIAHKVLMLLFDHGNARAR